MELLANVFVEVEFLSGIHVDLTEDRGEVAKDSFLDALHIGWGGGL